MRSSAGSSVPTTRAGADNGGSGGGLRLLLTLGPQACQPATSDRCQPATSDRLRDHLDRAARTLGHADAAALAVVEVDLVALARAELDDRVVGADAVAVVALEAVAAGQAAARLVQRVVLVEPEVTSSKVDWRRIASSCGATVTGASA